MSLELGEDGRRVRCARCAHIWYQAPEEVPEEEEETVEPVEPPPVRRPQPLTGSEPPPIPRGSNLPAFPEPEGRRQGVGWSAFSAMVIVLLGVGFFASDSIISAWPVTERLYAALNLMGEKVGAGLEIRNIKSMRHKENGVPVLVIEGEVANVSEIIRDVPAIRAALHGADKAELQYWTFKASETRLLPGEIASFSTRVEMPDKAAQNLGIGFADNKAAGG
jgi:hypothetical protein